MPKSRLSWTNPGFMLIGALSVLALALSIGVLTSAFLAWRAGAEGYRPGANVNLMRGSATTILLVFSSFMTRNAVREADPAKRRRRYAVGYSLLALAFVLLWFQFRWLWQR